MNAGVPNVGAKTSLAASLARRGPLVGEEARTKRSSNRWSERAPRQLRLRPRRDRARDGAQHLRQDVRLAQLLSALGHAPEERFHRLTRAVAPVAAHDEV